MVTMVTNQEDDLSWKQRMEERVTALEAIIKGADENSNAGKRNDDPTSVSTAAVASTSFSCSSASSSRAVSAPQNYYLSEGKAVKNERLKYFVENFGDGDGGAGAVFQPCCGGRAQLFTSPTNGDKYLFINPSNQFEFSFEFHPNGVVKGTEQLNEPSNKKFPKMIVDSCKLILVPVTFHYEVHNLTDDELNSVIQVYPDLKRYKVWKPYTALYVITGGTPHQGVLYEGTLTKSMDKEKVPLICLLMNKLTQKIKMSGLKPGGGHKLTKILHKFGGTISVPNWNELLVFWLIETIVKQAEEAMAPILLHNLDPFSNTKDLQTFFKRVGSLMENGGYPSVKEGTAKALSKWDEVLHLEEDKAKASPSPGPSSAVTPLPQGGGDEGNEDSESSSVLSLFIPVKTKIAKKIGGGGGEQKKKKSVRFGAFSTSPPGTSAAAGIPFPAKRAIRKVKRSVNVKIKRKWFAVKLNDVQGEQAWKDGKRVKVRLEDVRKNGKN